MTEDEKLEWLVYRYNEKWVSGNDPLFVIRCTRKEIDELLLRLNDVYPRREFSINASYIKRFAGIEEFESEKKKRADVIREHTISNMALKSFL